MATITNAISLSDKMIPGFNKMAKAMSGNLDLLHKMNTAIKTGVDDTAMKMIATDIEQASDRIHKFNDNINATNQNASGLKKAFEGVKNQVTSVYGKMKLVRQSFDVIKKGTDYLDGLSMMKARVDLANDGTQTTPELQEKISKSAIRSRADYGTFTESTIQMNTVAPTAFQGNDEAISFVETLNKLFVISGTSGQDASSAMQQLTQAMAAGRLHGDEFSSIIENVPMLANVMANSMGISRAELKSLADEGNLTAEAIKKAMTDSATTINEKFISMPMTFAQMATNLQTVLTTALEGVANIFSEIINSDVGQGIFTGLMIGIQILGIVLKGLMDITSIVVNFIGSNWNWISALLSGVLTVIGMHFIGMGIQALQGAGQVILASAQTAIEAVKTGAAWLKANSQLAIVGIGVGLVVFALNNLGDAGYAVAGMVSILLAAYALWQLAQLTLNGAMLASPITWILIAIIAIIMAIYFIIEAMLKWSGSSLSALGVIIGGFFMAGANIANILGGLANFFIDFVELAQNIFADFVNFFGNLFNDPIGAIIRLFFDLADTVLKILQNIANVIDMIFGSSLADNVQGWRDNLNNWVDKTLGEQEVFMEPWDLSDKKFKRTDPEEAFAKGHKLGEDLQKAFGGSKAAGEETSEKSAIEKALEAMNNNDDIMLPTAGAVPSIPAGMSNPTGGNLDSVDKINGDVTIADEDLKLLKDIATTKFVNKYSTLQPNLTVQFGDIHETSDLDRNRIIRMLEETIVEAEAGMVVQEV